MELILKVEDSEADFLLKLLENFDFVKVEPVTGTVLKNPEKRKDRDFSALKLNTKGFKFNREEANER